MKKLLLLGTSFASKELILKAKQRGWYTIVTDNVPLAESPVKQLADEYWMTSTAETSLLEEKCRREGIDAIFAGISEFNLDKVLYLTGKLKLPCYINKNAWAYARNKKLFKNKCIEKGIPVIREYPTPSSTDDDIWDQIIYPVIVKPVDSWANTGLSICHNKKELEDGIHKAKMCSANSEIITEQYITGDETWNYYFIAENTVRYVYSGRVFKQPGYPTYLYSFGTTAAEGIDDYLVKMNPKCTALLTEIGCRDGFAWIQCIRDSRGNYFALEMAHRLSADTSGDTLAKCIGQNPIDWMLDTAFGIRHTADDLPEQISRPYKGATCVYYLFAERSGKIVTMSGLDNLDSSEYLVENVKYPGEYIEQYKLMVKIVFFARHVEEIISKLQYLNQNIKITDADGQNMIIYYTDYESVIRGHKDF